MEEFSMESLAEKHPNPNYTTYHMRQRIVDDNPGFYSSDTSFSEDKNKLPSLTKLVVEKILDIRGVVKVACSKYEISVEKATAYKWDEIEPKIARIFTYLSVE